MELWCTRFADVYGYASIRICDSKTVETYPGSRSSRNYHNMYKLHSRETVEPPKILTLFVLFYAYGIPQRNSQRRTFVAFGRDKLKTLSKNVVIRDQVDEDEIGALLDKLDEGEKVLKRSSIFSYFVYVNRLVKNPRV
ncbi:hypothetical protein LguiA_004610 [Lonicera macranthoides]